MKLLRKLTAFILVFGLLAGTVAAMSAAVSREDAPVPTAAGAAQRNSLREADLAATSAENYVPRLTAPAPSNPYYYSDRNVFYQYGWGMPNCTCYAWGRAYEILHHVPDLCLYSAYLWYDYNIENQIYAYGSEPRLGAIACWVYTSGTSGHVAVVEKIENDTITFSNSAYSGIEFYTNTAPIDDPSDGRETWIFQGYIYLGDFENPAADTNTPAKPAEPASDASAMSDVYRITAEDGVNLRAGAGTSYASLGVVDCGQSVTVTKTKSAGGYTWGYTAWKDKAGWVALEYAKLIYRNTDEEPAPPPAAAPAVAPTQPATEAPTQSGQPRYPIEYAPSPSRTVMMGDLDGDGRVTIMDATRIQLIVADMFVPTKYMLITGDYDGDSFFSIMDAGRIRTDIAYDKLK